MNVDEEEVRDSALISAPSRLLEVEEDAANNVVKQLRKGSVGFGDWIKEESMVS